MRDRWLMALAIVVIVACPALGERFSHEATVSGESREAGLEAIQTALRAVVDSALSSLIDPPLSVQFQREIEARVHAQRQVFISNYHVPFVRDLPYDGMTTRRIVAELSLPALGDTLVSMGLAWKDSDDSLQKPAVVMTNLHGFSVSDGAYLAKQLMDEGAVLRIANASELPDRVQYHFLVSGSTWEFARILGRLNEGRYAVKSVEGNLIDVIHGGDPTVRPGTSRTDLPRLEIQDFWLDELFPSRYPVYSRQNVGRIVLANHGAGSLSNCTIEIECDRLLDMPWIVRVGTVEASQVETVTISVPFSGPKMMEFMEETRLPVSATVRWRSQGEDHEQKASTLARIHGRNAIDWHDISSSCAFVTHTIPPVQSLTRLAASAKIDRQDLLPATLSLGLKIGQTISGLELTYTPDPPAASGAAYDHVQFPHETISLRSGDCEDLSVLLGACMEHGDLPVMLLLTRDHVLLAFNTGLFAKDGFMVSSFRERYLVLDDMIWIPVETTILDRGFMIAWDEGIRTYREIEKSGSYLEHVLVRSGWQIYPPAVSAYSNVSIDIAADVGILTRELDTWLGRREKERSEIERSFRLRLKNKSDDHVAAYRLGVLLARTGRTEEALELFQTIPPGAAGGLAANSRIAAGNAELLLGHSQSAVADYKAALTQDPNNPAAHLNLGVLHFVSGNTEEAVKSFGAAMELLPDERGLTRLLGTEIEDLGAKAADAGQRASLSREELRSVMEKVRQKDDWKRLAGRGPSRHKFAGRKALDPDQRLQAERLIYWPEMQN